MHVHVRVHVRVQPTNTSGERFVREHAVRAVLAWRALGMLFSLPRAHVVDLSVCTRSWSWDAWHAWRRRERCVCAMQRMLCYVTCYVMAMAGKVMTPIPSPLEDPRYCSASGLSRASQLISTTPYN